MVRLELTVNKTKNHGSFSWLSQTINFFECYSKPLFFMERRVRAFTEMFVRLFWQQQSHLRLVLAKIFVHCGHLQTPNRCPTHCILRIKLNFLHNTHWLPKNYVFFETKLQAIIHISLLIGKYQKFLVW